MIEKPQAKKKAKGNRALVTAVVIVAVAALVSGLVYYFVMFRGELFTTAIKQPTQGNEAYRPIEAEQDGFIRATIFVPFGEEIKGQEAKIAFNNVSTVIIESVVTEFCRMLTDNMKGINIHNAYKDRDSVVYLDFSGEIKTKATFGAAQEYAFLKALYSSVATNVQGIADIRILVDGKETDTIAGHFNISKGLKNAGIAQ